MTKTDFKNIYEAFMHCDTNMLLNSALGTRFLAGNLHHLVSTSMALNSACPVCYGK